MNDRRIKGVIPADEGEKERGRKEWYRERERRGGQSGSHSARISSAKRLRSGKKICQSQAQFDGISCEKLSLLLARRFATCVPEFTYHSGLGGRWTVLAADLTCYVTHLWNDAVLQLYGDKPYWHDGCDGWYLSQA